MKKATKGKINAILIILLLISLISFLLMFSIVIFVNDYENFVMLLFFAIMLTYFYREEMKSCPSLKKSKNGIILAVFAFILGFVVLVYSV
jgi:peptidoglycan/LPS O-acetylase OafA/YrhL